MMSESLWSDSCPGVMMEAEDPCHHSGEEVER